MAAQNSGKTAKPRGRPFPPGVSGNAGGRPKTDRPLLDALQLKVEATKLAAKLVGLAMSGNLSAIRYIYDRLEGMPMQQHQIDLTTEAERLLRDLGIDATPEAVAGVIDLARERERRAG